MSEPTVMTEREFGMVFAKLAVQLQWRDADELAIRSYFEALKDAPLIAVQQSALDIAQHGVMDERTGQRRRGFFPTTAQWYDAAQLAMKDFLRKALPPPRAEPWHYDCDDCEDTGWRRFECPTSPCDRTHVHAPHDYVRSCPCRATNATYRRHQMGSR